ncbi:S-adenosyl-l-methionine hydroxide adenosyltransferase family protein [Elizabethkingia meningoseptica]|uniref:SAM hydrolase/SAM-dependent halogenase family protein n=1 Tax=Elizabethkingia meningoseptica TaxID=238 RepID=UPI0038924016
MSIITLTSDYGLLDYRVAAIKGSIYNQLATTTIVDITHEIQAYNLQQTAYIIRSAYKYYPKGTIHIISVDSFYHKDRKNIIAKVDDHYFICADNGLLSLMFFDINPDETYEIVLGNRFDDEVNFTSTDIFAPVAVHLAKGGIPEVVGKKVTEIKEHSFPRAILNETEGIMVGEIMYIDNFGNAISNIKKSFFNNTLKSYDKFELKFRNFVMSKVNNDYTDVVENWENEPQYHGNISAIFNADDLLEVAIYKGSSTNGASSLLGLSVGERIFVEFS